MEKNKANDRASGSIRWFTSIRVAKSKGSLVGSRDNYSSDYIRAPIGTPRLLGPLLGFKPSMQALPLGVWTSLLNLLG